MTSRSRPLAIVSGASTGIGYKLAKCAVEHRSDLIAAADEPAIGSAGNTSRSLGPAVSAVEADLATLEGVDALDRPSNQGRPSEPHPDWRMPGRSVPP